MDLITSVGDQEEYRLCGDLARKVEQIFEARVVTPVHIFDDEEQRMQTGRLSQEVREGLEKTPFILLWIAGRHQPDRQLRDEHCKFGEQVGEIVGGGTELGCTIFGRLAGDDGPEHVKERSKRKRTIGLEALAL